VSAEPNGGARIGADVGGTFTDVILIDAEGRLWVHKVASTPPHFERAVLRAVEHLLQSAKVSGGEAVWIGAARRKNTGSRLGTV
jgi:N-methylhydantoinase A/oxoprolinase/acetone carboxylase beta subunit